MSRYSHHQPPENEWPTRVDLADDNPNQGPGYDAAERAALVARVAKLQAGADRVRCWNHYCRDSFSIHDWPPTVRDCGHPICETCVTCDECERGAA